MLGKTVIYTLDTYDYARLESLGSRHPNNGATEAPATVVRAWSETCVNLKVQCDDGWDLWITSAVKGDKAPRTWRPLE